MGRGLAIAALGASLMAYATVTAASWFSCAILWSFAVAYAVGYFTPCLRIFWAAVTGILVVWFLFGSFVPIELNPNALGCAYALALAASVVYQFWFGGMFMAAGIVTTQSRTAILAAGVIGLVAVWRESRLVAVCLALMGIVIASAVSGGRGESILARLGIWQDTLNHLTLWGSGFGSFAEAYASWPVRTNMTLALAPAAYNDYLQIVFELGLGAILVWLLIGASLDGSGPKLPVLAFAVLSLSFFPLYTPIIGHLGLLALGHAAKKENRYG